MTKTSDLIDLEFVHSQFPGLSRGWTLMDNAGGSQTVRGAVERITEFLFERDVQTGGSYAVSVAAAEALLDGRKAAQVLTNAARHEEMIFGPSSTVLIQNLARAMQSQFEEGDEIILSTADHESNIGPWEKLQEVGVKIKFWKVDPETYELKLDDLQALMTERTRLVCVHHVSNILGQINPIADITRLVHAKGARICIDGVAYAPHRAIDVQAWDVDYYIFSLYKCYGPHIAIMYGKYDHLLELDGLYHYFYGKDQVPGKLEPGNANYELAYSTVGVVDYLSQLGEKSGASGSNRNLIEAAFGAMTRQEDMLTERLLTYLRSRNDCKIIGKTTNENSLRAPTIAFRLDGQDSGEVARKMDDYSIAIRFGDFHSKRLVEELGETENNGVVRVSMLHYNTIKQVDQLTTTLTEIAAG